MKYVFGELSKINLRGADSRWSEIMNVVIKHVDCSIIESYRGETEQNTLYSTGRSRLAWPNSKHNVYPSLAIDVVPYPIDWNNIERFRAFAFFVKGVAVALGHKVRLGADWDGDFTNKDQTFHDMPHMELID